MTIFETLHATEEEIYSNFRTADCIELPGVYMYIDNNHPICLVAHVDTLPRPEIKLIERNGIVTNKLGILGADDRAGVFALEKLKASGCNILLCSGEESGGIGARAAARDLMMTGVNLMLEFDRKGANEYVYYSYDIPRKTAKYIESYGYIQDYGSYSDIAEFTYLPAVNLSIGYYDQHTKRERLHLDEMLMNIGRARRMIDNPPAKRYDMPEERYFSGKHYKKDKYSLDIPDYEWLRRSL